MKNTKKRRLIVVVAMCALLAVVLAMGGTTFAKYVTSTEVDSQSATVAKWGFVVQSDAGKLWGTEYKGETTDPFATVDSASSNVRVSSASASVAPGTTGSLTFSIVGKAEVKANVNINLDITNDVYLSDGTNKYNPIVWKLYHNASAYSTAGTPVATGITAIEAYFTSVDVAAGANFDKAGYYTLTWEWAFDGAGNTTLKNLDTVDDSDVLTSDEADTILGYLADGKVDQVNDAYEADKSLTAGLALSIVVTQIK